MASESLTWKRLAAGHYSTTDGQYGCVRSWDTPHWHAVRAGFLAPIAVCRSLADAKAAVATYDAAFREGESATTISFPAYQFPAIDRSSVSTVGRWLDVIHAANEITPGTFGDAVITDDSAGYVEHYPGATVKLDSDGVTIQATDQATADLLATVVNAMAAKAAE